ncbi:MAG: aminopeptidase P N-terminal domain-containing protein [Candidatus Marinimicrobia bacterium]|nr:aminopeptidase P N-terminal domain-containing protein [Candidatus Neomarinimicrobiota bacterium]
MINKNIYEVRRERLMQSLGNGVAILKGAPAQTRTNDTEYPYRQDSDLFYFTGYAEPGAACIIDPNNSDQQFTLFVLPPDPEKEVWTGWRLSFEETMEQYGADQTLDIAEFSEYALKAMKSASKVFTNLNHEKEHQYKMLDQLRQVRGEIQRSGGGPESLESIGSISHEMRLFKDIHEIELMQKAADISKEAHVKAMQVCVPGLHEYQLQAVMESHFVFEGGSGPAYTSIVGSGDNATVLHYIKNQDVIKDGDLILIDAAAEYQMYASDITRTFPANGKYSDAQKAIYEVVLKAQNAVIEAAKPGVTFQELHDLDLKLLVEGMVEIGLLEGSVDEIIETGSYQVYFMHKTGHWLGLDVHDMGKYMVDNKSRVLEPGMVFTVEPGIYVNSKTSAPEKYRGIGIRIEDNILITEKGNRNLTGAVPKEIADIEAIMAQAK